MRRRSAADKFGRWKTKWRIVEEAQFPGNSVAEVACRRGVNSNLLFRWIRAAEAGQLGHQPASLVLLPEPALAEEFGHDRKLLAEEFIAGREIECSVLEDTKGGLFVSHPSEVVPAESHGFYSYNAKYIDENGAPLKAPAELSPEVEGRVRETAARAFTIDRLVEHPLARAASEG